MMMLTQCLESRFVQFELQVLFACKDGNFEKSGQLVRVAKIAPTLLSLENDLIINFYSNLSLDAPTCITCYRQNLYIPKLKNTSHSEKNLK
jgi:hypothetical protein